MINKLSFKGYSLTKENETAPVKTQNNITFNSDMQKLKDNPNSYYNRIMFTGVSKVHHNAEKHKLQNYKACLIGGAIGDALGYPVEFSRLNRIKDTYGSNGITNLKLDKGQAIITDDTQMTMFTADGLLKSALTSFDETKIPDMKIIYNSYQDWLKTQGYGSLKPTSKGGWISKLDELQVRRAPGNTCIGSLVTGIPGSIERPTNDSEGCGGVMRVAPVGLMYYKNPKLAFEVGARCAALTHGSPNAYLAAGIHSCIIANLVNGKNIRKAVDNSIEVLKTYQGSEKIQGLMAQAKKMANSDIHPEDAISILGEGWNGDEAIAIATYCVLKSPNNFKKALIMAVNHDGDSDSTGAIVGNILGTYLGIEAIPSEWRAHIELKDEIEQVAGDLYYPPGKIENAEKRYPIK